MASGCRDLDAGSVPLPGRARPDRISRDGRGALGGVCTIVGRVRWSAPREGAPAGGAPGHGAVTAYELPASF